VKDAAARSPNRVDPVGPAREARMRSTERRLILPLIDQNRDAPAAMAPKRRKNRGLEVAETKGEAREKGCFRLGAPDQAIEIVRRGPLLPCAILGVVSSRDVAYTCARTLYRPHNWVETPFRAVLNSRKDSARRVWPNQTRQLIRFHPF
jgi:hypothetical protein